MLREVAKLLREAKASESREMARAGAKWERVLGFFVKMRLITEKQKAERRGMKARGAGPQTPRVRGDLATAA